MRTRFYRYIYESTSPARASLAWFDLIEIALVALGFLLYFIVRGGVTDRTADALEHARWIIDLQQSLGMFVEPLVNQWTLEAPWRFELFNFVYFWLDFPLIIGVGLFWFWRSRHHYTLLRDSVLISGGIALIFYYSFPVAPPRYLPEYGFVDTLEQFANLSYQAQSMEAFVNPYAAVPSLHVGWSVLLAIVLFQYTRQPLLRAGGIVLLTLQTMAVVATANHYLFDAAAGVVVALVAFVAAWSLQVRGYPAIRAWFGRRADVDSERSAGTDRARGGLEQRGRRGRRP